MTGAKIATRLKKPRMIIPAIPERWRKSRRSATSHKFSEETDPSLSRMSSTGMSVAMILFVPSSDAELQAAAFVAKTWSVSERLH
jgi:hypothetical protein